MANSESIKKYLIEGEKSYLENDANNGNILMLSGVWGSGKTHFWKNIIEKDLTPKIKAKKKSYVFVSLYGKDSIEELQNEILQKSYDFLHHKDTDIVSQTYSVFTKMTSLMPKITVYGVGIDTINTSKQIEELNNNEKFDKGTKALKNGGVICFDDFERKSSKIDLNDLFGFITNLTENFNTKTIIITNQEVFQHHDQEVFNTVKEKSVNKFILYDPSIEELFDVIYQDDKYKSLESYKSTILDAIKLSEEKNARIYIQVLNNCLEYAEKVIGVNERAIYLLTLVTVIFVKHNLIFRMKQDRENNLFLPSLMNEIPTDIQNKFDAGYFDIDLNIQEFIHHLMDIVSRKYNTVTTQGTVGGGTKKPDALLSEILIYISKNKKMLFAIYKYIIYHNCFQEKESILLEKINTFVESGILLEE